MPSGFFGGFQRSGNAFQLPFQTSLQIIDIGPSIINPLPIPLPTPGSAQYQILELSDLYVSISYFDIFGVPFIPNSVAWRLWDDTNKVRVIDWTTIATPAVSNTINIPAGGHFTSALNLLEKRKLIFRIIASGSAQRYDRLNYDVLAIPGGIGSFTIIKPQSLLTAVEPGPSMITLMPTSSRNQVPELSDYYATIAYLDINDLPYTPANVYWRLWDATNKLALIDWTLIPIPGTTNTVDIPASAHSISNVDHMVEQRQIIFRITASGGAQRYENATYSVIAVPDIP